MTAFAAAFANSLRPPTAGLGRLRRPPWHGSSLAQSVYGGAERGISLARGFFTGEATWKPPPRIASAL